MQVKQTMKHLKIFLFNKTFFLFFLFNIPILANTPHCIPFAPFTTTAKPTVAPTILCVPDTGKLKNVATNNQIQQPRKNMF